MFRMFPSQDNSLIVSVKKNDLDSVKEYFQQNPLLINDERYGVAALHIAAQKGYKNAVVTLLKLGADVNSVKSCKYGADNTTAFIVAAQNGHLDVVKILLGNGAKMKVKRVGNTPLFAAVQGRHCDVVEYLIDEKNSDVDMIHCGRVADGNTPLCLAAMRDDLAMARLLIKKGANVNFVTGYDLSPLIIAASNGYVDVVKLLIDNDADVNPKTRYGNSPLHAIASQLPTHLKPEHITIVNILLENGADAKRTYTSMRGKKSTPLEAAERNNLEEIVRLINEKIDGQNTVGTVKKSL